MKIPPARVLVNLVCCSEDIKAQVQRLLTPSVVLPCRRDWNRMGCG